MSILKKKNLGYLNQLPPPVQLKLFHLQTASLKHHGDNNQTWEKMPEGRVHAYPLTHTYAPARKHTCSDKYASTRLLLTQLFESTSDNEGQMKCLNNILP